MHMHMHMHHVAQLLLAWQGAAQQPRPPQQQRQHGARLRVAALAVRRNEPAHLLWPMNTPDYGLGASGTQAADWPRQAGARCGQGHDLALKEASGAPAGRSLRHLVFASGEPTGGGLSHLAFDRACASPSPHPNPHPHPHPHPHQARGLLCIIAGAGGAAHLPGMVAAMTPLPVIGVPVKSSALSGNDSLLSIVQMPRGVPVATVAIGNAANAGLLAVRMLGLGLGLG